jgi:transposase
MKKKPAKRKQINELTPDVVNSLDRDTLVSLVMKLYEQNKQLSEQFQIFLQEKYGRKTETHQDPNQLKILPASEVSDSSEHEQPSPPKENTPVKKPGHTRNPMPAHLDSKKIRREPTNEERICNCGAHRTKINEVVRNRRFECIPATVYVEEIIDSVWSCPNCNDTIVVASDAFEPIPNSTAGPKLLTQIAEDRWLKHLPYYRQEQAFARLGINISRSTMCGWMALLTNTLLPIYEAMKVELLKSRIIATDDTPVKVQDRTKKRNIKRGYEWIFMGDATHPVNVFHYTEGRGRAGPQKFISGFKGYLQGDCFSGNKALCAETGATFVACRAHDRRYYKKAVLNNKLSNEMLDMYTELFEIEGTARALNINTQEVTLMRQQEATPILNKMKAWIDRQVLSALPASSFGKALTYSLNNWNALNNYLLDGELRIDNNLAEQQMKMFATGRKNWYFFGSDEAGQHASIMLSIFSTCLRNGITPGAYILDVLKQLIDYPNCNIYDLLPHRWKQKSTSPGPTVVNPTPKLLFTAASAQ